jgi:hypothetical protein
MTNGDGDTWACTRTREGHRAPQVYVQWKGTDVCLDFVCICGYSGHYDGEFAYGLKCAGCGQIYRMPHTFGLIACDDDGGVVQDTDMPHYRTHENDVVPIGEIRRGGFTFVVVGDDA